MLRNNQDGFDMARLQKHIKRQQRSSLSSQYSVTKLSPAEIRDLNNAAIASKNARLSQLSRSLSGNSIPRASPRTPPHSPDDLLTPQVFPGHQIYTNLPTPPISPDKERKDLAFANYAYPQSQNGRPQSSATSSYSSSGPSRRPSNASSYRGVTQSPRSGSMTLFQDSTQQIVTNPLSNFSRPRQSALQSPYDRYRSDQPISRRSSTSQKSDSSHQNQSDSSSLDQGIFPLLDPKPSVPQQTLPEDNEQEERIGRESERPPALRIKKKRSRSMPALMRSRSPSLIDTPLRVIESLSTNEPPSNYTALPQGLEGVPLQKHLITGSDHKRIEESKQKRSWRKNFNTTPKKPSGGTPNKAVKQTMAGNFSTTSLISISYADTIAGEAPQMKASLKEVLPSNRNPMFQEAQKAEALKGDFSQHPAVRPHSVQSDNKSVRSVSSLPSNVVKESAKEEKEDEEKQEDQEEIFEDVPENANPYPTYSRCSCCGKLRKPAGFTSNLSPVLENEHLRTNFSFELGRTSIDSHRHCSSSGGFGNRPKHIPIIPMEIDNQMRQATIEPYRGPYGMEEHTTEEQGEISRPGSAIDSGFVTAETTPTDTGRLSPVSRPGSALAAYPPPVVLARGKDEPKVVRFANLYQRKREIERRGRDREQKTRPGQEQMHSMSQIDNLYPVTEEARPLQVSEKVIRQQKKEIPDISPLTSSASSSEVDLVSRMPKPPVSNHRKVTSSNISQPKVSEYEFPVKREPKQAQQTYPVVDLTSLDGSAHRVEVIAIAEVRPVKQVITISAKEHHSESSEEDEYAEIARSSPFEEEAAAIPKQDFFTRAKSSSSPNSSDEALPLPPPSGKNGKTTTTVKIIHHHTIPIPERSPKRPQTATSVHEPMRIGDWILPTASAPTESQEFQPYQHYAAVKFDGIVSAQELPYPLSASSSRYNSLTGEVVNPSTSSSFSIFQVREAKNAQVTQVVTGGNGRVKEVGSSIARRMRAARRSTSTRR